MHWCLSIYSHLCFSVWRNKVGSTAPYQVILFSLFSGMVSTRKTTPIKKKKKKKSRCEQMLLLNGWTTHNRYVSSYISCSAFWCVALVLLVKPHFQLHFFFHFSFFSMDYPKESFYFYYYFQILTSEVIDANEKNSDITTVKRKKRKEISCTEKGFFFFFFHQVYSVTLIVHFFKEYVHVLHAQVNCVKCG